MESRVSHHEEEDKIYPLTLTEIANAQRKDRDLKVYFKKNAKMPQKDVGLHPFEDTKALCKNEKVIIPTSLRHRAVSWYHHYLQDPGHSRLELGWEFQFSVPISGTPIGSGIPIPFTIQKIPVGNFFLKFQCLESQKIGILIPKFGIPELIKNQILIPS